VWQYYTAKKRTTPGGILLDSFGKNIAGKNAYAVDGVNKNTDFSTLGYEQQGEIVSKYITSLQEGDANKSIYEAILRSGGLLNEKKGNSGANNSNSPTRPTKMCPTSVPYF
jgi:hypothetical protein